MKYYFVSLILILLICPSCMDAQESVSAPITVENINDLNLLKLFNGHNKAIVDIAFSPDGTQLASAGFGRTALVWDLITSTHKILLEPADLGVVTGIEFSQDGKQIIAGGNAELWLWDTETLDQINHSSVDAFTTMRSAFSLTASARRAVFADAHGNLTLVEVQQDGVTNLVAQVDANMSAVSTYGLDFSRDGTKMISGSTDGSLTLWNSETGGKTAFKPGNPGINDVVFSPDGEIIAVGIGNKQGAVFLMDDIEAAMSMPEFWETVESGGVASLAFSPDGKLLATGIGDGNIYLWDVDTGSNLGILQGSGGIIYDLEFSPDGTLLASAGEDTAIWIWGIGEDIRGAAPAEQVAGEALSGEFPSYSQVVATYPAGTSLCETDATIEAVGADGSWLLNGRIAFENSRQQIRCFGTKIRVNTPVDIDGVHYESGSFLTVNKDLEWVQVSAWD